VAGACAAAFALLAAGCGGSSPASAPTPTAPTPTGTAAATTATTAPPAGSAASPSSSSAAQPSATTSATPSHAGPTKVMVIAQENESYDNVLGSGRAPYLDSLARDYATATSMDAGYPVGCPSLASYLLMTAGNRFGICDDRSPAAHRLRGNNIFHQVALSGGQWRGYAESMPGTCRSTNIGNYLVRHVPATYFADEKSHCGHWVVPLGSLTSGALHHDVAAGTLPAYSFVTPNDCNDMHGGAGCAGSLVPTGDRWLRRWMKQIMAGPDYRAGRLVVVITWDEGIGNNHIPLLVISPSGRHVVVRRPITHCTMLRTVQDVLNLPPLGCAAKQKSLVGVLKLRPGS
jgi:phosphatidylinositol-3-phosphatase